MITKSGLAVQPSFVSPLQGPSEMRIGANGIGRFIAAVTLSACAADDGEPAPIRFVERTADALKFFHFETGSRGRLDLPEIMGGGLALFDVDGDGLLDLYLCDGGPIDPKVRAFDPPCRLWRNRGNFLFDEMTTVAHATGPSYAMGCAVGDVDGDGRDDLFVTGWRNQRLYRNLGGWAFDDITAAAHLESDDWSTSAAFADLDSDGDLDLYVCAYLKYDPTTAPYCAAPDGKRDYCGPELFAAQRDHLYRNDGAGRFTEIPDAALFDATPGRALGLIVADLVGSPLPDIFVANDGSPCKLYENLGEMRFREVGMEAGVAVDGHGEALAAMGVALGDLDGDGRDDLIVTNYFGRATVVFQQLARGRYRDASVAFDLPAATRDVTGFGLALQDFDADGDLDLLQANGHVVDRKRLGTPFEMATRVLRNDGGRLRALGASAGAYFDRDSLGRGIATGDLNGDGAPDVVVASLDGHPVVLQSEVMNRHATIAVSPNRRAVGARVRATIGTSVVERQVVAGGSYLSASSSAISFGLAGQTEVAQVEVIWPDGSTATRHSIRRGETVAIEYPVK